MSVLIPKMKVLLCITELKAAGRACVGDYFIVVCGKMHGLLFA